MALFRTFLSTLALIVTASSAFAAERPVVLELFTSQGCNSCPPADALLKKLAAEPGVIALSYHVDYWDYIGWKDAFSLKESTKRQYEYAARFKKTQVFTPELVIDGMTSVIGSREQEVRAAIDTAKKTALAVPITLAPKADKLALHLGNLPNAPSSASILAVRFKQASMTDVKAGENKGHALVSTNSVTAIEPLGNWTNTPQDLSLAANKAADEGIAILLQDRRDGRILAAATYIGR